MELPEKENDYTALQSELNEQKKKLSSFERDYKHQLSLITNPDFAEDINIKKVYLSSKRLLEGQKIIVHDLENKVATLKNFSPKENVKRVIAENVNLKEFEDFKRMIHSLIDWIKIGQVKEDGKMGTFIINIKYRGFDEVSTFITNWFALKWVWISKYRKEAYTQAQIEEDRENAIALFEHHNIVVDEKYKDWLRQKGMTEEEIDRQNPWSENYVGSESNSLEHSVIVLKEEDLVHFN